MAGKLGFWSSEIDGAGPAIILWQRRLVLASSRLQRGSPAGGGTPPAPSLWFGLSLLGWSGSRQLAGRSGT